MSVTSGAIMDRAAALLNDTNKNVYSYIAQIPYLNVAIDELVELMELNNVPMTNEVSSVLVVTTAMTDIGGSTGPALPTDLVEIQKLFERDSGVTEDWQEMARVEYLPPFVEKVESLVYWTWQKQIIQFLGATTNRDVKINYIGATLANVSSTTGSDTITTINCKSFLAFRTASLCAEYIDADPERAAALAKDAVAALDRNLGINTKGRQAIGTRRRPFMASYKVRSGF